MPKLNADKAKEVADSESTGGIMDDGIYEMLLKDVEVQDGPKGPYWKWTFKVPEDAPRYKGWQQWLNTSLSEAAVWKLKEVFDAFGAPTDTDTDELIGKRVRVVVGSRTIQKGKRAGEQGNQVEEVLALDAVTDAEADARGDAKPVTDNEPLF